MFKERAQMIMFANMVALPSMLPGILLTTIYNHAYEKAIIFTLVCVYPCYVFYSKFHLIKSVAGYLTRFYISCIMLAFSFLLVSIAPEKDNMFGGAVFFVMLPCIIFTSYILTKSEPAIKLKHLIENS